MAVSPTWPGVYLTETAATAHGVIPATTNETAFIGVFPKGPVDKAVHVTSAGEFETQFGGLTADPWLAPYAVDQFFANGGTGAWIVRVTSAGEVAATVDLAASVAGPPESTLTLDFAASSPGEWANGLTVTLQASGSKAAPSTTHVDLLVQTPEQGGDPTTVTTLESITNLDATKGAATVAALINAASNYVIASVPAADAAAPAAPATPPVAPVLATGALAGGADVTWTTELFSAAVNDEVGNPTVSGNTPPPAPRLDAIAPAVFNIMCIPDLAWLPNAAQAGIYGSAHTYCKDNQAFLIVDPPPPPGVASPFADVAPTPIGTIGANPNELAALIGPQGWAGTGLLSERNVAAAAYYPWITIPDPMTTGLTRTIAPSGAVAGLYAATDTSRGVWKAPAGLEVAFAPGTGLADPTVDDEINGELNVVGINCLRTFTNYGTVVWGSRTLAGNDLFESIFKYVPARRLTDFIEQSLEQSLRWAVFEPNEPALWASISLEVTNFMTGLAGLGAFMGPFTVACDATTTTADDMQRGIVNVNVAFPPVDPAEFVVLNVTVNAATPPAS